MAEVLEILFAYRLPEAAALLAVLLGTASHGLRRRIANADLLRNLFFLTAAVLAIGTVVVGVTAVNGKRTPEREGHPRDASPDRVSPARRSVDPGQCRPQQTACEPETASGEPGWNAQPAVGSRDAANASNAAEVR